MPPRARCATRSAAWRTTRRTRRAAAGDPSLGAAIVVPAIRAAFADVGAPLSGRRVRGRAACPEAEFAEATLRGGGTELERIVAELAKNACEGNGVRGAARVAAEVDTRCEPGFVHVRIADDGPGLSDPIGGVPTAFVTTKPQGSGLGLYTAAGVLGASGGSLALANRPERRRGRHAQAAEALGGRRRAPIMRGRAPAGARSACAPRRCRSPSPRPSGSSW